MEELILSSQTMSSLQISELTGKAHKNVIRDIQKLLEQGVNGLNFEPVKYIDSKGEYRPCYNLTKKGCLILASGYNAKLREKIIDRWEELEKQNQKNTSSLPSLTPAELILQQSQLLVEQERKINRIEEKVLELDARTKTRPDWFTIAGYATLHKIQCSVRLASSLGRKAASLCRQNGIIPDSIPDPRFGEVKLYPSDILQEVFNTNLN